MSARASSRRDPIVVCPTIARVLAHIPAQDHLVSAAHDGRRSGSIVRWVQRCGLEPPLICISMRKGHPIEPLIRDSRAFALSEFAVDDTLLRRLFGTEHAVGDDPFLSVPVRCTPLGSPVPVRAAAYLDCELVRHFDIECDHEIYVGLVRHAGLSGAMSPDARDDGSQDIRAPRSA